RSTIKLQTPWSPADRVLQLSPHLLLLPPAVDERMVERDPHRPRIERAHDARVAGELRSIALELLLEERTLVAAKVRAGLEVDDVAVSVRDEASVENDVRHAPFVLARERPLAVRVGMRRIEQPPTARIVQRAGDDVDDALRSVRAPIRLDAFAAKLGEDARSLVAQSRFVPADESLDRHLREQAMRYGADRGGGCLGPIERRTADCVREMRHRQWFRQFGHPPSARQPQLRRRARRN